MRRRDLLKSLVFAPIIGLLKSPKLEFRPNKQQKALLNQVPSHADTIPVPKGTIKAMYNKKEYTVSVWGYHESY